MKKLTDKIRSLIYVKRNTVTVNNSMHFDFVKNRKGILRELLISKESGNILGIYCRSLGEGMFLTVVEDIEVNRNGEYAVFGPYDLSGRKLSGNTIEIGEIQMVCPFNKPYRYPLFGGGIDENYSLATL